MASQKKGLGRGFDSLIPTDLFDESFDPTAKQDVRVSELRQLKLEEVMPDPDQPRRHFDEHALGELAASLKEHGLLQPIVVTPKDGKFMIVAGERRYRAAKLAKLDRIAAIVRTLTDQHKLEISLIENIQRRDLNAIETATAYLKLRDQFNLTLDQIGARVGGKSVSAISNTLRLLKLPHIVKQAIVDGKISEGQARPMIGLDDETAEALVKRVVEEGWSDRRVEQVIAAMRQQPEEVKKEALNKPSYGHYEEALAQRIATNVRIKTTTNGSGQVVIAFNDQDDLDRIHRLLTANN